jgi:hypothetical protein
MYVRGDEMHQAFNFDYLQTPWRAADIRRVIGTSLEAADSVGAPSTWVLSNHDVVLHASRLGLPVGQKRPGAGQPRTGLARSWNVLFAAGHGWLSWSSHRGVSGGRLASSNRPDSREYSTPTWGCHVRYGQLESLCVFPVPPAEAAARAAKSAFADLARADSSPRRRASQYQARPRSPRKEDLWAVLPPTPTAL